MSYTALGDADHALGHLRYYLAHADSEDAERVINARLSVAQALVTAGRPDEAVDQLQTVRPSLVAEYGEASAQARNLDSNVARIRAQLAD